MASNYYYDQSVGAWMLRSQEDARMMKLASLNAQMNKEAKFNPLKFMRNTNHSLQDWLLKSDYLASSPHAYRALLSSMYGLGGAGAGALAGAGIGALTGDAGGGAKWGAGFGALGGFGTGMAGAWGVGPGALKRKFKPNFNPAAPVDNAEVAAKVATPLLASDRAALENNRRYRASM